MKIIFMGTPDFAVPSLEKLIAAGHNIAAVFTKPDKPKGRGHKMQFSPIKELAVANNIPVYQPVTLKNEETVSLIENMKPDVIVVVAYGKILPVSVLNIPKYGCINVHGSLLPRYRGSAPIQWAVLNGDAVTGITTMFMGEGVDTGDMLMKAETPIGPDETSGELFDRLKIIGADLLIKTLSALEAGEITRFKQDDTAATYAPMITKEMAAIDWNQPAEVIKNKIRGLNPWPCAVTEYMGKRMKIFSSAIICASGTPGELFESSGKLCVYCSGNALVLTDIQLENGKRMSGEAFLLGHPIAGKTILK